MKRFPERILRRVTGEIYKVMYAEIPGQILAARRNFWLNCEKQTDGVSGRLPGETALRIPGEILKEIHVSNPSKNWRNSWKYPGRKS